MQHFEQNVGLVWFYLHTMYLQTVSTLYNVLQPVSFMTYFFTVEDKVDQFKLFSTWYCIVKSVYYKIFIEIYFTKDKSGVNVDPRFINFILLLQALQPYQRPQAYQILDFFHGLRIFSTFLSLFKALRLFFLSKFPVPTFIPCPTSIMDSRVYTKCELGTLLYNDRLNRRCETSLLLSTPWPKQSCLFSVGMPQVP